MDSLCCGNTWILQPLGRTREPRATWEEVRDRKRDSGEVEIWDETKECARDLSRQRGRHHQDCARDGPEGRGAGITRIVQEMAQKAGRQAPPGLRSPQTFGYLWFSSNP